MLRSVTIRIRALPHLPDAAWSIPVQTSASTYQAQPYLLCPKDSENTA
jgi:hypothetical protein